MPYKSPKLIVLILIILFGAMNLKVLAQKKDGVQFQHFENWNKILENAISQNKIIFIDCFTTWCGPCRQMDNDVYSNKFVGENLNSKFISIRLQCDETIRDDSTTKATYTLSKQIQNKYKVQAYPTYLFINSKGELLFEDLGYKGIEDFLAMVSIAGGSKEEYLKRVEMFRGGIKDYKIMPRMIDIARQLKEQPLVDSLTIDYKKNYFDRLDNQALLNFINLRFIYRNANLLSSRDRIFKIFLRDSVKADQVMGKGFSKMMLEQTIIREEIHYKLQLQNQPILKKVDWRSLSSTIKKKYSFVDVDRVILGEQIAYYHKIKDWSSYIAYKDEYYHLHQPRTKKEQNGNIFGDAWILNTDAWDLFEHCNDPAALKKALEWSELSIKLDGETPNLQFFDTKANLLYKLGNVSEAIFWEEKAHGLELEIMKRNNMSQPQFNYAEIIEKMKKGIPTWK